MAVNPVALRPEPRDAIQRARRAFLADGLLERPKNAPPLPAMPTEMRDAIERLIAEGTYAAAAAEVIAEDPELDL